MVPTAGRVVVDAKRAKKDYLMSCSLKEGTIPPHFQKPLPINPESKMG
jgi:hypothetical protein